MASRLGTVFVELELSDKIYKQKLADIEPNAIATARGVETAWRALGTKSSEYFDQQRKAAENAFTLIKTSATTSANDIIRAEEAKNERIKFLNDQQFGSQTHLIDTLKGHWLAATAAIAVATGIAMQAWDLAKIGAEYEEQRGILDNLSKKYGTTAEDIVAAMQTASDGLIAKSDLMQTALGGIAKGLQPEQLINLADAARILGDAAGVDATTALQDLTTAMETGKTRALLPYLGTSVDLKTAFGDLEGKMTAAEKAQAMYSMTMTAAIGLQAQQTKEVSDAADKIERMEAAWKNAKLRLAEFAATLVVSLLDAPKKFADMSSSVDLLTGEIIKSDTATKANTISIHDAAMAKAKEKTATEALTKPYQDQIDSLKKQLTARTDNEKKIKDEAAAAKKAADDMAHDAKRAGDAYIKAYEDEERKAEAYYEKVYKWQDEQTEKKIKDAKAQGDAYIKMCDDEEKKANKFYDDLADKVEKEKQDAIDLASKRLSARESMYKGLTGYDDAYYNARVISIGKQRKDYEDLTGDVVAAAEWEKKELLRLDIDKAISSGTFTDGVIAALKDITTQQQTTWGATSFALVQGFSRDAATAFGTSFYNVVTGNFKDIGTAWNTLWQNAVTTLGQKIGEMIVQAAMKDVILLFKAEWTTESSSVLGLIDKLVGIGGKLFNWATDTDYSGSYGYGDQFTYAKGGRYPTDHPFWVGEQGPEIIIPDGSTSGIVLSNQQSKAYSAMNGGYIPGYAKGTLTPGDFTDPQEYQKYVAGINAWANVPYPSGLTAAQTASYNAYRYGMGDTWAGASFFFGNEFPGGAHGIRIAPDGSVYWNFPERKGAWWNKFMTGATPAIIAAIGTAASGNPAFGAGMLATMQNKSGLQIALSALAAYLATQAGEYIGEWGNAPAGAQWEGPGGGFAGVDWSDVPNMAIGAGKQALANLVKSYLQGIVSGDGLRGSANVTFEGFGGDLDWLAGLMGKIAPRSDRFAFHARNGLDYVPYDNFPAVLHKGERVQTAKEASSSGKITIHNHLYIDGREIKVLADEVVVDRNTRGVLDNRRMYQ